jgi:hypothetical protein
MRRTVGDSIAGKIAGAGALVVHPLVIVAAGAEQVLSPTELRHRTASVCGEGANADILIVRRLAFEEDAVASRVAAGGGELGRGDGGGAGRAGTADEVLFWGPGGGGMTLVTLISLN